MLKKIRSNRPLAGGLMALLMGTTALLSLTAGAAECHIDHQRISAHYQMEVGDQRNAFVVYRNDRQVAHHYQGLTDVWSQLKNGQVALNRYFDEQQRGIEYQPQELTAAVNWQLKSQLVTDQTIAAMTLVATVGEDCYQQAQYTFSNGNKQVQLTWLPQLKLVKRLVISTEKASATDNGDHRASAGQRVEKVWQLTHIEANPAAVMALFAEKDRYQTTDYADIGDSESDPFLAKMIHLGFIPHPPGVFHL